MQASHPPQPAEDFAELVRLGHAARHRGDRGAALGLFQRILDVAPEHQGARLEAALELRELGRLEEAEQHYRAVLAQVPTQLSALLGLGHIARQRGEHEAALAWFEAAAAAHPDHISPHVDAGDLLRALGRLEEAEPHYRAVLARAPTRLSALLGLGHIARRQGEREAALAWFEAAAAAHPDHISPHVDAGDLLRGLDRLEEAERHYRAVLARVPEHYSATIGLAMILRQQRDRSAARNLFEKATRIEPERSVAWLELATEQRDAGAFAAARTTAEALLAHQPTNPSPWLSIGHTERQAGRRAQALEAFRCAAQLQPDQAQPLVEMAIEARALGQPQDSRAFLERSLELDAANPRALQQLGEHTRLAGDFAAALDCFQRACAADPLNPGAWCGMSQALIELGRGEEALARLEEAEGRCGPRPELLVKRAELLRQAGEWSRAREVLRRADPAATRSFPFQMERLRLARLADDAAEIEAILASLAPRTTHEEARLHHFRGQLAEDGWRLDEAITHYERALALLPADGGINHDLARVRLLTLDLDAARRHLRALSEINATSLLLQGRSPNISQSLLGEILNETALDRGLLGRLVGLQGQPPAARIEALLPITHQYPEHTPAAAQLLIAMRQAGWFGRSGQEEARAAPIPRNIAQYWNSPEPPRDVAALMRSWREAHPDYGYRLFCDADAQAFLEANCAPEILAAYRRSREPAHKADLFRLAWLHAEGGWYADADGRCLVPLGSILPPGASLVLYQEEYGTLGNNFIGAARHEPVIGRALASAAEAILRGDADIVWFATGPGLMTRAFMQELATSPLRPRSWLGGRVVLTRRELFKAVAIQCDTAHKRTTRSWLQSAIGKRRKVG